MSIISIDFIDIYLFWFFWLIKSINLVVGDAVVVVVVRWNFCLEVVIISGTIIFTRCYHSFRIGIIFELNRILKFSRYCFLLMLLLMMLTWEREKKNILFLSVSLYLSISFYFSQSSSLLYKFDFHFFSYFVVALFSSFDWS